MPVCPACRTPLPPESLQAEERTPCPSCGAGLEVEVYPALTLSLEQGSAAPLASVEGDSTCFYHAGYRAAVPCDECGRFLCGLCDLPIGSRHLCPECLHRSTQDQVPGLTTERILWDRLALSLAVLPTILFYFTILTAPAAIYIAVRRWKSPGSLVTPGRWRFVVAIVVATLQLGGWAGLVYLLANAPAPPAAVD
jgi:hypothetical protein